jgi:hypothetical protein
LCAAEGAINDLKAYLTPRKAKVAAAAAITAMSPQQQNGQGKGSPVCGRLAFSKSRTPRKHLPKSPVELQFGFQYDPSVFLPKTFPKPKELEYEEFSNLASLPRGRCQACKPLCRIVLPHAC